MKNTKDIWIGIKLNPSLTKDVLGSYSNEILYEHSHRFTFNVGIETAFELSKKRWYLDAGLYIMDWGYKEKQSSTFYTNYPTSYIVEKNVSLTLPVNAVYKYKMIYCGIGINSSYFVYRKRVINDTVSNNNSPFYGENPLFGVQAKIGLSYKIKEKIEIRSEAYYSNSKTFGDWTSSFILQGNDGFYSVGLSLGINYKLK